MNYSDKSMLNLHEFDKEIINLIKGKISTPLTPICLEGYTEENNFDKSGFTGKISPSDDKGFLHLQLNVLSTIVMENEAEKLIESLQPELNPLGCQVLIAGHGTKDFCDIFNTGILNASAEYDGKSLIVFFKSETPEPLIWLRQTNGANFDILPDDIIQKLKGWAKICDFFIMGTGFDWISLKFKSLPDNLLDFAEDIYEFCPDTLDQNIVMPVPEGISEEDLFDFIDEALEKQGIGDLVDFLKREKYLFLWWD